MLTLPPPRCWVKAKTLPLEIEAKLTAAHGKVARDGSKDSAVEGLVETLNKLSSRVHPVEQGSPVADLLANLNIIPGKSADEAAVQAAQVWAIVEDQEGIVEAMRLDAVDETTEQLNGPYAEEVDVFDDEKEDGADESTGCRGDDESTGCRRVESPSYADVSRPPGKICGEVRQSRRRLPPAEGQHGVHRSACL